MPEIDGYATLEFLRKQVSLAHIPVLAVTANAMAEDIKKGDEAGFNDYIVKPFNIDNFLKIISKYINNK